MRTTTALDTPDLLAKAREAAQRSEGPDHYIFVGVGFRLTDEKVRMLFGDPRTGNYLSVRYCGGKFHDIAVNWNYRPAA